MITDEMARTALAAFNRVRGRNDGGSAMRAALQAFAPLIAAQARRKALEEAAEIAENAWNGLGGFEACQAAGEAIRALKERA